MIKKDEKSIEGIYKGTTEIASIYKGTDLLYENYKDRVVSGTNEISLLQSKANSLEYLKVYGKCEQGYDDLPLGYTRLSYIESSGTQYINTGIAPNSLTRVDYKVRPLEGSSDWTMIIAARMTSSNTGRFFPIAYASPANTLVRTTYGDAQETIQFSANQDLVGSFDAKNSVSTINNVSYSLANNNFNVQYYSNHIYLFGGSGYGDNLWLSKARIYYVKIWDNTTLVRSLIPCKRNSDGVIGMYDSAFKSFYTNQGTGTFIAGEEVKTPSPTNRMPIWCNNGIFKIRNTSGLPLLYTKLKYIESSGTQYIDTGFSPDSNTKVEYKVKSLENSRASSMIIGTRLSSSGTGRFFPIAYDHLSPMTMRTTYGNIDTFTNFGLNEILEGTFNPRSNYSTINDTSYSLANSGFVKSENNNLYLFGTSGYGSDLWLSTARIYYVKITDLNTVVRNFVPCRRNSDNVVGMYDKINDVFYTNSGTGTFIAGEVDDSVEMYIQGTTEKITINGSSLSGYTAEAVRLLGLGNYKDVQSVLDGNITRNTAIMAFDGTEAWVKNPNSPTFYLEILDRVSGKPETLCTHYEFSIASQANIENNYYGLSNSTTTRLFFIRDDRFTTVSQFTDYLKQQYRNATPMMFVYPLETPITQSYSGQPLTLPAGDNTITIWQSSMPELELEAKYKSKLNNNISNDFTFSQLDRYTFNEIKKMTF